MRSLNKSDISHVRIEIMNYALTYNGLVPTMRWVKDKTQWTSTNTIHKCYQRLIKDGFLGRTEDDRYYIRSEITVKINEQD